VTDVTVIKTDNDNELRCFSCAADNSGVLWSVNISNPKKAKELYRASGSFLGSVQHPLQSLLIITQQDGTWIFYDTEKLEELNRVSPLEDQQEEFTCSALHPDGEYLVAGTNQGNAAFWMITENGLATVIKVHDTPVTALSFSEGGYFFATHGEGEDTIKIWDLKYLETVSHIIALDAGFDARDLCFDPSGRYLAVSGKTVLIFKAGQWGSYSKIDCHQRHATCTRFGGKG